MIRRFQYPVVAFVFLYFVGPTSALPQSNLEEIKAEYQTATTQLQKHVVGDWWIDDDPESPKLLARQWSLTGEWVAAWLNAHPSAGAEGVKAAISNLVSDGEPQFLRLSDDAFLVAAPNPIGNVFIVTKAAGQFRLAWSTADLQKAQGKEAEILAAWRPENGRQGGRGPYYAASGSAGSVIPQIGILPADTKGQPRFYINGTYAQSAGGTVGAQTSVWLWDGKTALPLIVRDYAMMVDQKVWTRVEGDLLKVQEKKFFRTFFSCGSCEERQTDWVVRLEPEGVKDLGEESTVPELDAVDELFFRVIHHEPAADMAAPAAIKEAEAIVEAARKEHSEKEWSKYPSFGMMGPWNIRKSGNDEILCLSLDDAGTSLFLLRPSSGKFFVAGLKQSTESCQQ
jgi:hypothetical protein